MSPAVTFPGTLPPPTGWNSMGSFSPILWPDAVNVLVVALAEHATVWREGTRPKSHGGQRPSTSKTKAILRAVNSCDCAQPLSDEAPVVEAVPSAATEASAGLPMSVRTVQRYVSAFGTVIVT